MAFAQMVFSPATGLRDTTTYPKQPVSEAALRDAIQDQSDQLRDYINNTLIAGLESTAATASGAHYIASAPISGVAGDNVYEQLTDLKDQVDSAVLGELTITDLIDTGDIQTDMLDAAIVTNEKMAPLSVGTDELIDSCATTIKIGTGAITNEKMADDSVGTNEIIDANVTYVKLAADCKPTAADVALYIDADNGSDTSGDGTSTTPYKTGAKAASVCNKKLGAGYDTTLYYKGTSAEVVNLNDFGGDGTLAFKKWPSASTYSLGGFVINSSCTVVIDGLTLTRTSDHCIRTARVPFLQVSNCIMITPSSQYGINIANGGFAYVYDNTISYRGRAINCIRSTVNSKNNGGVSNTYGLVCTGGFILKSGTQPTGTTMEYEADGGQID